ncbi:HAD-IIA family hydrolase [soil metagenome]
MSQQLDVDAVLFDIDGVLAVSWQGIPHASAAVRAVRDAGLPIRFVTNTTSRSAESITYALHAIDIEVHHGELLTAALSTARYIERSHPGANCLVLNSGEVGEDLESLQLVDDPTQADIVVVGGAGPEFSYDALDHAFRALQHGATLIAMHRNMFWATSSGNQLDAGAFVAALEAAAGVDAIVMGKPSPTFFAEALRSAGASPARTAMVGDDVHSDVLGAQRAGIVGVLVHTGKYRPEDVKAAADAGDGSPDHQIDSVADLPALLGIRS